MHQRMSQAGLLVLMQREGCRLRAYRDSVGVWTIGVGHTGRTAGPAVYAGMTITKAQALAILAADLAPIEAGIAARLKRPVSQACFDALVSFVFNIGLSGFEGSAVLRLINAGDMTRAADAFMHWCKPPELAGRRRAERLQFLRGLTAAAAPAIAAPVPLPAPRPAPARLPRPIRPASPPAVPAQPRRTPVSTTTKAASFMAFILALFGASAANAAAVDFAPLVSAGVDYLLVPILGALATWILGQAAVLLTRFASRYPKLIDQQSASLLASNVDGVLHKAISWAVTEAQRQIHSRDLHADVDGWVAKLAADYAVAHAPDLMKQAGNVGEKLFARLTDHPAVQELKAQVDQVAPLELHPAVAAAA